MESGALQYYYPNKGPSPAPESLVQPGYSLLQDQDLIQDLGTWLLLLPGTRKGEEMIAEFPQPGGKGEGEPNQSRGSRG